jgi:hypothetical protein
MIGSANGNSQATRMHLDAVSILKYFLGTENNLETIIMCDSGSVQLVTTDYELYLALGSMSSYELPEHSKLVKFLERVDVMPFRQSGEEKKILTHETVESIRQTALKIKS